MGVVYPDTGKKHVNIHNLKAYDKAKNDEGIEKWRAKITQLHLASQGSAQNYLAGVANAITAALGPGGTVANLVVPEGNRLNGLGYLSEGEKRKALYDFSRQVLRDLKKQIQGQFPILKQMGGYVDSDIQRSVPMKTKGSKHKSEEEVEVSEAPKKKKKKSKKKKSKE